MFRFVVFAQNRNNIFSLIQFDRAMRWCMLDHQTYNTILLYITREVCTSSSWYILASQVPGRNLLLNPSWLVDLPGRRSSFFWFGTPKASRRLMIQLLKSYFKELMRMITRKSEVGRSQSPRRIRKSPSDPALLLPRVLLTVGLLLPLPRRIDSIH